MRRRDRVGLGGPVVRLVRRRGRVEHRRGRRLRRQQDRGGRGRGVVGPGPGAGGREHLDDLDVPEHPVLGGAAVRHVVGDGVPPGRDAAVGPEVLVAALAGPEAGLELITVLSFCIVHLNVN